MAVALADETITTPEVNVTSEKLQHLPSLTNSELDQSDLKSGCVRTSDTASLLADQPGVSLYGAGGVSSLPAIHGMADDRVRVKVDGMDLVSSCPNHMNSPLSYLDPTSVGTLKMYAGIAPVSLGGDSIGGTIVAETRAPEFAASGQGVLVRGEVGARYHSNGDGRGANVSATMATENFSATYSGAMTEANNYKAADNFKNFTATGRAGHFLGKDEVGSTAYESRNHNLDLALKSGNHLVELKLGYQDIPYEFYPNQRMDMLENEQARVNLRYLGQFDWGSFEARAYHERVRHTMDFGDDKMFLYTAGNTTQGMPMRTQGRTTGVNAKFNIDLTAQDLLRVGAEYQHYTLQDWWPAVVGSMGMGPNDFTNVNDGERDRAALFGEWEKRLAPDWTTLLGVRYEQVDTSAGMVHGYNLATAPTSGTGGMMSQTRDAVGFNNSDRNKTDRNWDMTATARYTPDQARDVEFGVARKVRSPNLYERYSWSTASMMAIMNNYVGDGNGYIGDVNLKSEKAYTASATFDWHAADHAWEAKVTPYYTYVDDYIDAIQWNGTSNTARTTPLTNQFATLKYANQSARLYGLDFSGHVPLGSGQFGQFGLKGLLNYTKGENRDTGDDLYNIMPLNAKLTLTQKFGGWDNQVEWVGVTSKDNVSNVRNEIKTPGYSLVNLRGSYSWSRLRVDFGVENLLDKMYYLPLGGAYVGQGTTMGINSVPWGIAVPGMGRSLNTSVTFNF
jgi:iron complex outermembrane receptor protein